MKKLLLVKDVPCVHVAAPLKQNLHFNNASLRGIADRCAVRLPQVAAELGAAAGVVDTLDAAAAAERALGRPTALACVGSCVCVGGARGSILCATTRSALPWFRDLLLTHTPRGR